jgi:CheY-like chemotaxis protein
MMVNVQHKTVGGRKILVVDDSNTQRVNLSRVLENAKHQVIVASSGDEAVEMTKQHHPDLIFMDIIMDNGDGYKATRAIKRDPDIKSIPVVMVSSKNNPVDKRWAEKLGAKAYIEKPYTGDQILAQLVQH